MDDEFGPENGEDVIYNPVELANRLSPQERQAALLRGDGWKEEAIAKLIGVAPGTVKSILNRVYTKLRMDDVEYWLDKVNLLHDVYAPILKALDETTNEIPPEPEAVPEEPASLETETKEDAPEAPAATPSAGEEFAIPPRPPRKIGVLTWIMVGVLGGCTIMAVLVYFGRNFLPFAKLPQTPTLISASLPATIATPASTLIPTARATLTAPPIQAPPIPPTTTALVPDTPTVAASSTVTMTASPTPPAGIILFSDNFDAGINPAWQKVTGDYAVTEGKLVPLEPGWLVLDAPWSNYQVMFDANTSIAGKDLFSVFSPRFADTRNFVGYLWNNGRTMWYLVKDGRSTYLSDTLNVTGTPKSSRFVIMVKGDSFTATVNDQLRGSAILSQIQPGKLGIFLRQNDWLDNLVITEIE